MMCQSMLRRVRSAAALLLLSASAAQAAETTISARYSGDASGRFENTTPQAGFCGQWPQHCEGTTTVGLPITYTKRTVWRSPQVREQFFVQVPSQRKVTVIHDKTGEAHELVFEFTHVSQRVTVPGYANPVFTAYVKGGCSYQRTYTVGPWSMYLWRVNTPQAPTACYSSGDGGSEGEEHIAPVSNMGIGYNLSMPSPLRMKQGIYRGSLTYSIGPGGDFDFGNDVTDLNDSTLTLHFELDVQHTFVVQFAPGSERAVLEPPGGWQAWLGGRGAPSWLRRELPFRLWSTGPFKVYKLCQYDDNGLCAIRNPQGSQAAVSVALTLPQEVQHGSAPVRRLPLPTGPAQALEFEHVTATMNRAAELHFEVDRQQVGMMLEHPGTVYEGLVTVVFESDL